MKAAIDLISRKLANSEYSHQSSWAHLRANQLRYLGKPCDVLDFDGRRHSRDWREYDLIYIYHGMDYHGGGALNVFDGMVEHAAKFFERVIWPQHEHIKYVSLDIPMQDYGSLCKKKGGTQSDYWKNVDWDKVSQKCNSITDWVLDPIYNWSEKSQFHLTIGDSHAHSAYVDGSVVLRKDERTLAGVMRKTIQKEITDWGFDLNKIKSLTTYFGNIDVRHHLCREADPIAATKQLVANYELALKSFDRPIEVVKLLPIEDESRKIPKSGYFKGTPFFGSKAERQAVLQVFNDALEEMVIKNKWSIYRWPRYWYEMDGIEFMNTFMERPRSVHLARKYYRTDLANGGPNKLLHDQQGSLLQF